MPNYALHNCSSSSSSDDSSEIDEAPQQSINADVFTPIRFDFFTSTSKTIRKSKAPKRSSTKFNTRSKNDLQILKKDDCCSADPIARTVKSDEQPSTSNIFSPKSCDFIDLSFQPRHRSTSSSSNDSLEFSPIQNIEVNIKPVKTTIENEDPDTKLNSKSFAPIQYDFIDNILTRRCSSSCSEVSSDSLPIKQVQHTSKENEKEQETDSNVFVPVNYDFFQSTTKPELEEKTSINPTIEKRKDSVSYDTSDSSEDENFVRNPDRTLVSKSENSVNVPLQSNNCRMREEKVDKIRYKRVNTRFVMKPLRKVEGETPQRPFPEELCWHNKEVSGTATEIFDMIFPTSFKNTPNYCPWLEAKYDAPSIHLHKIEEQRQKLLQAYKGPTEDEKRRQKQKKTLEELQETLWLVHSQRKDKLMDTNCRLMIQKCSCRIDETQQWSIISENDLSLIWNLNVGIENLSILSQRENDWKLRPVFIDGLSLLDTLFSENSSLHKIPTKVLLETLLHFILDGHKSILYLPAIYQEKSCDLVDDMDIFKFLYNTELIQFINKRSRKTIEREILRVAEESYGIIVSSSENITCSASIQCFPVFRKHSPKADDFVISTFFENSVSLVKRLYHSDMNTVLNAKNDEEIEVVTESLVVGNTEIDTCTSKKSVEDKEPGIENETQEEKDIEQDSKSSAIAVDSGVVTDEAVSSSSDTTTFESYQSLSNKCRIYTDSEITKVDASGYQLTLKRQVFLISSLIHLTTFHLQRHRQIRTFLMAIGRFVPQLLPHFMQKSIINKINISIIALKTGCLQHWPIFSDIESTDF